jgi:hypothetical protein
MVARFDRFALLVFGQLRLPDERTNQLFLELRQGA